MSIWLYGHFKQTVKLVKGFDFKETPLFNEFSKAFSVKLVNHYFVNGLQVLNFLYAMFFIFVLVIK